MAGGLYTAEGHAGIGCDHLIDEDHTGFKIVDEPFAFASIVRPRAGAEAEPAVIGDGDGLIDASHTKDAGDRAKEFLGIGGGILRDVRKNGWGR